MGHPNNQNITSPIFITKGKFSKVFEQPRKKKFPLVKYLFSNYNPFTLNLPPSHFSPRKVSPYFTHLTKTCVLRPSEKTHTIDEGFLQTHHSHLFLFLTLLRFSHFLLLVHLKLKYKHTFSLSNLPLERSPGQK